ncbi:hypothetical protein PIB30_080465 [Stylosanthes scabra]|uniref:Uncharacterized protein n=1 Tax=Stylosanthes scabra TaxID=79078 RepID=A0ABU6QR13_9FABA|nr:hypothetical protein [Stylosanthes scabra]
MTHMQLFRRWRLQLILDRCQLIHLSRLSEEAIERKQITENWKDSDIEYYVVFSLPFFSARLVPSFSTFFIPLILISVISSSMPQVWISAMVCYVDTTLSFIYSSSL